MEDIKILMHMEEKDNRKSIEELSIIDDFLLTELMLDGRFSKEFSHYFLETVLEREVTVKEVKTQCVQTSGAPSNRAARLDVTVDGIVSLTAGTTDMHRTLDLPEGKETKIDIEMQNRISYAGIGEKNSLRHRSRLYQSLIDINLLHSGQDFDKMKDVLVILCCSFDLFGRGRMKYTFENRCIEEPDLRLEDGVRRIFLNTKGEKGATKELRELLRYIEQSTERNATNAQLQKLHSIISTAKCDKEMEARYMLASVNDWYLIAEGRERGRKEGIAALILDNLESGASRESIINKIQKRFLVDAKQAESYYSQISNELQ